MGGGGSKQLKIPPGGGVGRGCIIAYTYTYIYIYMYFFFLGGGGQPGNPSGYTLAYCTFNCLDPFLTTTKGTRLDDQARVQRGWGGGHPPHPLSPSLFDHMKPSRSSRSVEPSCYCRFWPHVVDPRCDKSCNPPPPEDFTV